jgi:hypothetical protein
MRRVGFVVVTVAMTLVAHWLVYALSPSPAARVLGGALGGPRPLVVAAVALCVAMGAAFVILWLARLAVLEQHRLEVTRRPPPRLALRTAATRAGALFAASSLLFTVVENVIHYEQGYGWHLIRCITGPVHVDAVPILAAMSLVVSALVCAADHVLAWARRTLASATAPLASVVGQRRERRGLAPMRIVTVRLWVAPSAPRAPPLLLPA